MAGQWPSGVRIKPIVSWPGQPTAERRWSPFKASWSTTLDALDRELYQLDAENVVLQVAIREQDFRVDGYPRSNAKQTHPGVILTFDSIHGPLSYPCDTFTDWQDNVRAIVLAMESLRRVDRYGVTKRGEQYAGWKQLPAGSNGSSGFANETEALAWMRKQVFALGLGEVDDYPVRLYRKLAARLHPDRGGDPADWDRLDQAKVQLERAGML